jgi:hypothetical protein
MTERFNSTGSFSVSIPAAQPANTVASPASRGFDISDDGKPKSSRGKGTSKESTDTPFDSSRPGVSRHRIGLIFGIILLGFGVSQCAQDKFKSFMQPTGEVRQYKRMIQRSDLPGR